MRKTVILVIASRSYIYDGFIHLYWIPFINYLKTKQDGFSVYLLFGEDTDLSPFSHISENIIKCPFEETFRFIYHKTVYALEHLEKTQKYYDFVFRTNLSSFIIYDNFLKVLNSLPIYNVHSGFQGIYTPGQTFIAGAGFFLSRDLAQDLIKQEYKELCDADDVNISMLLPNANRILQNRYDIVVLTNYPNKEQLEYFYGQIIEYNHYHIRIKNSHCRQIDLQIAAYLTSKFYINN